MTNINGVEDAGEAAEGGDGGEGMEGGDGGDGWVHGSTGPPAQEQHLKSILVIIDWALRRSVWRCRWRAGWWRRRALGGRVVADRGRRRACRRRMRRRLQAKEEALLVEEEEGRKKVEAQSAQGKKKKKKKKKKEGQRPRAVKKNSNLLFPIYATVHTLIISEAPMFINYQTPNVLPYFEAPA